MDRSTKSKLADAQRSSDSADLPASDEQLALRAQQGSVASFEELAKRFQVPLLHYLRRWATDEDAEDLLQETLVRAYRNLTRYRTNWRFGTWLFTIARRLSINWHQQKRWTSDRELEQIEDSRPQPHQVVAQQEQKQQIWSIASEVLTEPQMTATWLHYVEEMPVKQIARVLGRSQVATKATLFRARKRLLPVLRQFESNGLAAVCPESIDPQE